MKIGRKKGSRPETISKYLNCLIAYQQKSGKYSYVDEIGRQFNVGNRFATFLHKNEIIYQKNGYYYWNDVYEPNIKIVKSFLDTMSLENRNKYIKKNKELTPTLFDQKRQYKRKIKTQLNNPENIEDIEKISIRDAVRTFGKSDSYFRRIQREWKVSKPKAVFMYEGKVHFDINELNKKFKKHFVEKTEIQSKVNEINTVKIGVIRKFIKWLW